MTVLHSIQKKEGTMQFNDTIQAMRLLAQLDADAAHAYSLARERMGSIGSEDLQDSLERFRREHERHYQGLSEWLDSQRVQPPRFAPDLQGRLSSGFNGLSTCSDAQNALKILHSIARTLTMLYEETTIRADLPKDLYSMLVSYYADNERHLSFLEREMAGEPETV
jgi:hypothetical protein